MTTLQRHTFIVDALTRTFALPLGFVVDAAEATEQADGGTLILSVYGESVSAGAPLVPASLYVVNTFGKVPQGYVYHTYLGFESHLYVQG